MLHIRFWEYEYMAAHFLWLILLIPLVVYAFYRARNLAKGEFKFSRTDAELTKFSFEPAKLVVNLGHVFLAFSLLFIILGLAKPMNNELVDEDQDFGEGIDIMLSLDVSGSMLATDFKPNRLEAAKEVAKEFVDNRRSDRIGLVVYEGEAYTAIPATRNHDLLKSTIDDVVSGKLEPGTAIGLGLGTAVARLRSDSLKSKVVILLSDGENNKGDVTPIEAAQLAKEKNIRVYTIGVGKEGYASTPVQTPFGPMMQETLVTIDEELLTAMAELTGGKYFRATDNKSLRDIYKKIDKMEKTKMVEANLEKEPPYHPGSFITAAFLFFIGFLGINFLFPMSYE